MLRLMLLMVISIVMSGCFSSMSYQTADTLKKGEVEVGAAADAYYLQVVTPEFMARAGLGENLDGGLKVYGMGTLEMDLKFRVSTSGDDSDRFSVALQPNLGVYIGDSDRESNVPMKFGLGILISKKLGKTVSFYAAGRVNAIKTGDHDDDDDDDDYYYSSNSNYMEYGGTLGFSFDFKHFWFRPEVTAMAIGEGFGYIAPGLAVGFKF